MNLHKELFKSDQSVIFGSVLFILLRLIVMVLIVLYIGLQMIVPSIEANTFVKFKPLQYDIVRVSDQPDLVDIGLIKPDKYGICKRVVTLPEAPLFNRWGPPLYMFTDDHLAMLGWMQLTGNPIVDKTFDVMQYKVYNSIIGEIPNL